MTWHQVNMIPIKWHQVNMIPIGEQKSEAWGFRTLCGGRLMACNYTEGVCVNGERIDVTTADESAPMNKVLAAIIRECQAALATGASIIAQINADLADGPANGRYTTTTDTGRRQIIIDIEPKKKAGAA